MFADSLFLISVLPSTVLHFPKHLVQMSIVTVCVILVALLFLHIVLLSLQLNPCSEEQWRTCIFPGKRTTGGKADEASSSSGRGRQKAQERWGLKVARAE